MAPVIIETTLRRNFYKKGAIEMKNSTAKRLAQVPQGYLMIGIDPHKKKHAAVVMDEKASIHQKFKINNSKSGFEELLKKLEVDVTKSDSSGMIFAIESGTHFWRNLVYYLDAKHIQFRLVSPFTLKRRREGEDLNRQKNDYRDAEMAAELLRTGKYLITHMPYQAYADIRAAYHGYLRLVKENTRQINLLKALLDGVFPELTQVFKDLRGKTALAVLESGLLPYQVSQMTFVDFLGRVKEYFVGRAPKIKMLRDLYQLAPESSAIYEGATAVALEIQLLTQRIKLNQTQITIFVQKLRSLVERIPESAYILSIPGLSYLTAAGILAGLGDINDYQNSGQLIKMAGTNPTQKESAGKASRHTPMSKQGRAYLRAGLWPATVSILRYNNEFKSWAKARQARPEQSHPLQRREVIGAALNRLLRIVFSLVKNKTYYKPNYQEIRAEAA
jgi:transposase